MKEFEVTEEISNSVNVARFVGFIATLRYESAAGVETREGVKGRGQLSGQQAAISRGQP